MVLNVHRNRKAYWGRGEGGMEVGEEGDYIYTYRYTVSPQNDFCIKMGSDESRFIVSLIVRTKSQDSVHRPQLLKGKESRSGFEPKSLCLQASVTPYR